VKEFFRKMRNAKCVKFLSQNVNYIHFSSIILIPAGPLLHLLPLCYKVFDEKMGWGIAEWKKFCNFAPAKKLKGGLIHLF
jgi:hypothetical protein